VTPRSPKRWLSSGLTLGLLYLSFAVFSWGLQYKLSLYQHLNGSSDIPAAKLLAGDETAIHLLVVEVSQTPSAFELCLLFTSFTLFLALEFSTLLRTLQEWLLRGRPWKIHRHALFKHLFFRPPPALV
jgi:hypothetical protein